jgi:hypothetical protein
MLLKVESIEPSVLHVADSSVLQNLKNLFPKDTILQLKQKGGCFSFIF